MKYQLCNLTMNKNINNNDIYNKNIDEAIRNYQILKENKYKIPINKLIKILFNTLKNSKTIFIFGNGGSASDSQHIAGEFVSKFLTKNRKAYPAISLASNQSIITSIANDYDYSLVFERQIDSLCKNGDTLVGLSTSGKSENVLKALKLGKKKGLKTILLTGKNCKNYNFAELIIKTPASRVDKIQELHLFILHHVCEIIEKKKP